MEVVERELERIAKMDGGLLDERRVWEESRPPDALLHKEFTWDDRAAAAKYRDQEARQIIQAVYIVDQKSGDEVRQWHNVVIEDRSVYVPIARVVVEESLKAQVLSSIRSDIAGARARLTRFEEFSKEARALDKVLAALGKKSK